MGDGDKQIKYINVGMEFTNKVCKKILENLEGDERDAQLEIMKNTMKVTLHCNIHYFRVC